jgi:hypothetical protein
MPAIRFPNEMLHRSPRDNRQGVIARSAFSRSQGRKQKFKLIHYLPDEARPNITSLCYTNYLRRPNPIPSACGTLATSHYP